MDDAGVGDGGVFGAEFCFGVGVGDEGGGVDVAAIDVVFVVDAPAPAVVHGFCGGEGVDGFVGETFARADDGAVAEEGVGEADEGFSEFVADEAGVEARGVDEEVCVAGAAVAEAEGGDGVAVALDGFDGVVFDEDAEGCGLPFEVADEFDVFDVVGEAADGDDGAVLGVADEGFAAGHEGGGETHVLQGGGAVEAVVAGEVSESRGELWVEGVGEFTAFAPEEADAEFPCGLGAFVEVFWWEAEVAVEVEREERGGAFADADDADFRAADDGDVEVREDAFEGDGGDEAGGAAAEDEDLLDHGAMREKETGRSMGWNGRVKGTVMSAAGVLVPAAAGGEAEERGGGEEGGAWFWDLFDDDAGDAAAGVAGARRGGDGEGGGGLGTGEPVVACLGGGEETPLGTCGGDAAGHGGVGLGGRAEDGGAVHGEVERGVEGSGLVAGEESIDPVLRVRDIGDGEGDAGVAVIEVTDGEACLVVSGAV